MIIWDRLFGTFLDEDDAIRTLKATNAEVRAQGGQGEEKQEEVLLFGIMPVLLAFSSSRESGIERGRKIECMCVCVRERE